MSSEPESSGHCEHHGATVDSGPAHGLQSHDDHAAHAHHRNGGGAISTSFHATIHCLTGCLIGEVVGVAIGVSLGLDVWLTMTLATALAYTSGFALGVLPVMKSQGLGFLPALKLIWLGEAISIGVMEFVMNTVDYRMGGMTAPSIFHWSFWNGFLYAVPAGFVAAWPVNWFLLSRNIKRHCH